MVGAEDRQTNELIEASNAPTMTVPITAFNTIMDNGVTVYEMWQFDAIQATQVITQFNEPPLLLIDVDWLTQAGTVGNM